MVNRKVIAHNASTYINLHIYLHISQFSLSTLIGRLLKLPRLDHKSPTYYADVRGVKTKQAALQTTVTIVLNVIYTTITSPPMH